MGTQEPKLGTDLVAVISAGDLDLVHGDRLGLVKIGPESHVNNSDVRAGASASRKINLVKVRLHISNDLQPSVSLIVTGLLMCVRGGRSYFDLTSP